MAFLPQEGEALLPPPPNPCQLTTSASWLELTGAVPPAGMVKGRGRGQYREEAMVRVVEGDGSCVAKSESGSVVASHKSNSFSSAAITTEQWVRPVAKGHDVTGSTSLVELEPSELACRCDGDGPPKLLGIYMATRRGGSEDNVNLQPPLSSSSHHYKKSSPHATLRTRRVVRHRCILAHRSPLPPPFFDNCATCLPHVWLASHEEKEGR
uniref:Uncharacterized protein n=1 Tax=Oryza meridionalis TaxID=40149 RepID=A0A0E0FDU1_9ORYZ